MFFSCIDAPPYPPYPPCFDCGCLIKGTKIITTNGITLIEKLSIGDKIISHNGTNKITNDIVAIKKSQAKKTLRMTLENGIEIEGTRGHLFFIVEKQEYVELGNLKKGNELLLSNGQINKIAFIEEKKYTNGIDVYDLSVNSPHHNYFAEGALVHNKSPVTPPKPLIITLNDGSVTTNFIYGDHYEEDEVCYLSNNANLANTDLFFANLSNANLSNANLSNANLGRTILFLANLTGAHLIGAHLALANLNFANLNRANLANANLIQANLTNANLTQANLTNTMLIGEGYLYLKDQGIDGFRPYLRYANLSNTDLRNANLSSANLWNANLNNANLSNANLNGAGVGITDLRGANLQDADLRGANLQDADLRGANLQDADLSNAYIIIANLGGADLNNANFYNANFYATDLSYANLRNANLGNADLRNANLTGALGWSTVNKTGIITNSGTQLP